MKTRMILSLGLSALVLGGTTVGCTANNGGLASAGTRDAAAAAKTAVRDANRARDALAEGQPEIAVTSAEAAVALMPQNAGYRALLGQGYLKAGRFASARDAFTDSLALDAGNGRTALNLALAQVALGDWQGARATLDAHQATIPATDRGLALALAGDPAGGAQVLTAVVRSGAATAKDRQNLALALALAGQWQGARIVAAADMSPADVDRRLEQWATFAKPQASSDQVAALLGVRPVNDPGQPVALALTAPVPVVTPAADQPPVPVALAAAEPAPIVPPVAAASAADVAIAKQALSPITEARPAAVPLLAARPQPIKVAVSRPGKAATETGGKWFVQVGAFRNPAVARDGWAKATRRMPSLAQRTPTGARFAAKSGAFYRLAFGGFARTEADALCRRFRATGGNCFIRPAAGDQQVAWAAKPVQLAAR